MVLQEAVEEFKSFQSIYSHCNLPSQLQRSTSIDFDSDAENMPELCSCEILQGRYKNGEATVAVSSIHHYHATFQS